MLVRNLSIGTAILALFVVLVLEMPSRDALLQSVVLGLSVSSIYILAALGLTLLFGMMHIINFAHGSVYMLGAYAVYYLFQSWGLPYGVSLTIAILMISIFGVIIEKVLYRPLGGALEATLVAFLGLTLLLQNSGQIVFGVHEKGVRTVFPGVVHLGSASIAVERLAIIPVAMLLVAGLYLLLYRTKVGQAMRAIEQDREAAALQGIDVDGTNRLAFALGFGLAAAAGALIAPMVAINPHMGEPLLLKAFIIIIIGGLGSLAGSILGGLILGLGDSMGTVALGADTTVLIMFLLVILFLLFKPTGLLGRG
jgi:branched-chain amino acid transport system permease protein